MTTIRGGGGDKYIGCSFLLGIFLLYFASLLYPTHMVWPTFKSNSQSCIHGSIYALYFVAGVGS